MVQYDNMKQNFRIAIFISIVFLAFVSYNSAVLASDAECTPPYFGYVPGSDSDTKSGCEAKAKYCVLQGTTGLWVGYNSTKVGNSCTLDGSGAQGNCNVAGECILSGQCDEVWTCLDWAPLTSAKTCGAQFTQRRTCTDAADCGTTSKKPSTSQTAFGTSCSEGKTCENKKCVAASGGGPTNPGTTPAGDSACPPGQICNPLKYGNFEDLINAIIVFIFNLGLVVAPIMFVISGILFVTSAGDPGRVKTAKNIALYTAIGFAVILVASGLIKVLQSLLGGS